MAAFSTTRIFVVIIAALLCCNIGCDYANWYNPTDLFEESPYIGFDGAIWYDPTDLFEDSSYVDNLGKDTSGSTRYYLIDYSSRTEAVETTETGEQTAIWAFSAHGLFAPLCNISGECHIDFDVLPSSQCLYIQLGESQAAVTFVRERWGGEPYTIVHVPNVSIERNGGYIRGRFCAKPERYTLSGGKLVPYDTDEYCCWKPTFWFQVKVDPLPDNQAYILKSAKERFGEVIRLVLEQVE